PTRTDPVHSLLHLRADFVLCAKIATRSLLSTQRLVDSLDLFSPQRQPQLARLSTEERDHKQRNTAEANAHRSDPDTTSTGERGDGTKRNRHLKEGDGIGEAVVTVQQVIGLMQLLVSIVFERSRLLRKLDPLRGVALFLLGECCRGLPAGRQPGVAGRFLNRRLDALGLVICPLV